jgi:hypothetical protein
MGSRDVAPPLRIEVAGQAGPMALKEPGNVAWRRLQMASTRNIGVSAHYPFFVLQSNRQDGIPGARFADERQGIGHGDGV